MTRLTVVCALAVWVGAAFALSPLRWFRTPPLVVRLSPYRTGDSRSTARSGVLSSQSLREIIVPLAAELGNRISRLVGVRGELSTRLERIDSHYDVNGFRLRQVMWSGITLASAGVLTLFVTVPTPVGILLVVGAPLLAFLVIEQQVVAASDRWQRTLLLELPVVIEQLGMLLSSGYSLGSAVSRLGTRGRGIAASGLRSVSARVRQGISEVDALREWAAVAGVPALDRLVAVLAMNWEAGDLGNLISNEARAVRREVQRGQVEIIERRGQLVWIPVTIATLLPGVIFMSVPFVDAVSKLTGR